MGMILNNYSKISLIFSILMLNGCATRVLISDRDHVVTDSANPNYSESKQVADAECAKYNRNAKMTSGVNAFDRKVTFDCIERNDSPDKLNDRTSFDMYSELKKLNDLLNARIITQAEFDAQKKIIFSKQK